MDAAVAPEESGSSLGSTLPIEYKEETSKLVANFIGLDYDDPKVITRAIQESRKICDSFKDSLSEHQRRLLECRVLRIDYNYYHAELGLYQRLFRVVQDPYIRQRLTRLCLDLSDAGTGCRIANRYKKMLDAIMDCIHGMYLPREWDHELKSMNESGSPEGGTALFMLLCKNLEYLHLICQPATPGELSQSLLALPNVVRNLRPSLMDCMQSIHTVRLENLSGRTSDAIVHVLCLPQLRRLHCHGLLLTSPVQHHVDFVSTVKILKLEDCHVDTRGFSWLMKSCPGLEDLQMQIYQAVLAPLDQPNSFFAEIGDILRLFATNLRRLYIADGTDDRWPKLYEIKHEMHMGSLRELTKLQKLELWPMRMLGGYWEEKDTMLDDYLPLSLQVFKTNVISVPLDLSEQQMIKMIANPERTALKKIETYPRYALLRFDKDFFQERGWRFFLEQKDYGDTLVLAKIPPGEVTRSEDGSVGGIVDSD